MARASLSIPGIFAPTEIDGRLLVEADPADPLPVTPARALGANFVVAVATTPAVSRTASATASPAGLSA